MTKALIRVFLLSLPGIILHFLAPHNPWGLLLAGGLPLGAGGVIDQKALQGLATWDSGNFSTQAIAGATLMTAAQMLNGSNTYLILTGAAGAQNLTTPSAQQLVQQMILAYGQPPANGSTFTLEIVNQTNGTITVVAGAGVSIVGSAAVATVTNGVYLCTFTNIGQTGSGQGATVSMQRIATRNN